MCKYTNEIFGAICGQKSTDEALEKFFAAITIKELLSDEDLLSIALHSQLINMLLLSTFRGKQQVLALEGLKVFQKNLETNTKINKLLKSGNKPSTKNPIICMSIHNSQAAADFINDNLDVLVASGYGHILVEHYEPMLEWSKKYAKMLEQGNKDLVRLVDTFDSSYAKSFMGTQSLLYGILCNLKSTISHLNHLPDFDTYNQYDLSSQEGYVCLKSDGRLWRNVIKEPGLNLHFAEHFIDLNSSHVERAKIGTDQKFIKLRDIGFALELGLASLSAVNTSVDKQGSGALIIVGCAHAKGISEYYKCFFPGMPIPIPIYPCVLNPGYDHNYLYYLTRTMQRRSIQSVNKKLNGRFYLLDLSNELCQIASKGLFAYLLKGEFENAAALNQYIQVILKESMAHEAQELTLQVNGFIGNEKIAIKQSRFDYRAIKHMIFSGIKDMVAAYCQRENVRFACLELRYRMGERSVTQLVNVTPILFNFQKYPMYSRFPAPLRSRSLAICDIDGDLGKDTEFLLSKKTNDLKKI